VPKVATRTRKAVASRVRQKHQRGLRAHPRSAGIALTLTVSLDVAHVVTMAALQHGEHEPVGEEK
jgi:hypothetical protein